MGFQSCSVYVCSGHEPWKGLTTEAKDVQITMAKVVGVTIGYLLSLTAMLSILEPQGLGWTLATAAAGVGAGTAALLSVKRAARQGFTAVFGKNDGTSIN